ncbi:Crp/Fnr family transcriptional regulator [Aureibacter tunicatorum]|uniref:CRP-like cAMP-binding protein n=1 Tax=Aureibacter tunicatorum TaxID=866807 RepID=A0AAE3XLQ4_9BACT|nr:Crp/Fnr family transcriptional regulator [Aureibacter tunicatorum]MDR6238805.1 CRP-like cAMP-binding protein [Aureibacter tunicatorum]BDD05268.1 cAMP-binding protein [Aureibacter tunicatorum]
MELLKNCISNQISIDNQSLSNILSEFEIIELNKGDFFLNSGSISKKMAFIESGFLRMYNIADGKEVTFWIGSSGKFITSLSSFVFQTVNFWNIQAVTDCKLYVINREKHFELCTKEPKWLEFDNKLLAYSFALLEKSMFAQLHTTANERFLALMKEEPELFQNVPLQYIASMLGITPESLSRLRKNLHRSIS